ncbi:hypothetical protein NCAS_0D00750 [Naumovozyma castellii]|uniref:Peroxisomal membrane protein PEX14 n=1 Tax=Naumovozyma castellii TaxID=27288 RepID=G0VEW8_NAUCA|nr:hypothetical protein NCAS_0D00750 [Naumovozyma castellii CBS 4309]CCC69656.1 hypothetical protein NCAS_0D00750 [Naumovozyma castellii CBS 4309]
MESRSQLISSAVAFLSDSGLKDAPLTKKIEFLQNKGLTEEEIEHAINESTSKKTTSGDGSVSSINGTNPVSKVSESPEYLYEALPPLLPRRDWKDYFVMATATAGLLYGAYEVTKRYVIPNILPESKTKLEQDKEEIKSQFDRVDKVLNAIEQEQTDLRAKEEEKLNELDTMINELHTTLEQTTETRSKMESEFKMLKLEMTNLQNSLDNFISSNKNTNGLDKVSTEVESLKNLIKSSNLQQLADKSHIDKRDGIPSYVSNGVPGIDAIPTASDLLAKLNIDNDGTTKNGETLKEKEANEDDVPAWKRSREKSLQGKSTSSIPAWQTESNNATGSVTLPDWQTVLEEAGESAHASDSNK